ncbi:threonylcarbamoyl-AMP synthase [Patescibacteria group bacterium]|nr:threonylcarbamoyl-AMP synthase [Patescibacteria group bacterium]
MKLTADLDEVVKALNDNQVVAFPTETSYGFLGNATKQVVIQKILDIKGRSFDNPLSVLVRDEEQAQKLVDFDSRTQGLFDHFLPGPLTIIARTQKEIRGVSKNGTLALRISSKPEIDSIFKEIDFPLTATSANLSGKKDLYSHDEVVRTYKTRAFKPDLVYQGGEVEERKPSTIVDVSQQKMKLVRQGEIDFTEIQRIDR